ncbi:MAG: hypothetical protein IKP86_05390, partial [Anaerolineaceae bacterium]|nr:hypothetical protein [Anaerolineaceae bacterium]
NRFSESYLDISRQLEKGISELASLCVTRAVFEKQGARFTMLKELDLDICAGIIRYHFRKSHDAAQKTEIRNQKFWKQMVEMETRWYHLAKRIDATADRIDLIRSGKISVDSLIKDYERRKIRNAEGHPKHGKPASADPKALPPASAVSFPVIGEFLSGQTSAVSVRQTADGGHPAADGKHPQEETFYPSMKARKKAERLAQKQAREAASANRNKLNSETRKHSASHNDPESMQDPFAPGSGTDFGTGSCRYKAPSSRHSARCFRGPAAFPCEDYSPGGKKGGIPPERA